MRLARREDRPAVLVHLTLPPATLEAATTSQLRMMDWRRTVPQTSVSRVTRIWLIPQWSDSLMIARDDYGLSFDVWDDKLGVLWWWKWARFSLRFGILARKWMCCSAAFPQTFWSLFVCDFDWNDMIMQANWSMCEHHKSFLPTYLLGCVTEYLILLHSVFSESTFTDHIICIQGW